MVLKNLLLKALEGGILDSGSKNYVQLPTQGDIESRILIYESRSFLRKRMKNNAR